LLWRKAGQSQAGNAGSPFGFHLRPERDGRAEGNTGRLRGETGLVHTV
jgi:hypothetical protein